jgi:hypothetical protein
VNTILTSRIPKENKTRFTMHSVGELISCMKQPLCDIPNPLRTLLRDGVLKFHFFSIISISLLKGTIVFYSSSYFQRFSSCLRPPLSQGHLTTTWHPCGLLILMSSDVVSRTRNIKFTLPNDFYFSSSSL